MEQKKCSLVVAYDRNRGIGFKNDLPWGRSLPADLRHFRELTTGGAVIMGRKTYESIGRPLPNRKNIVLTRGELPGVEVARSLDDALTKAGDLPKFIIGGETIYRAALESGIISKIFATEIDAEFPADAYFPKLDENWRKVCEESHLPDKKNLHSYSFVIYEL